MKKILRRAKDLADQAELVREFLETAPERIEQAKGIVTLTTSQLQQLRTDVQASIAGLRADTGDDVTAAVEELNEGSPTFIRAGYALAGVDLELGLAPRLTAPLERVSEIGLHALRAMLAPNSDRRVIHGILSALVKAEELAGTTHFEGLHYSEVSIQIGPAPTLRLRWRAAASEAQPPAASLPPPIPGSEQRQPAPAPLAAAAPAQSAFAQTSYFEPRSAPAPAFRQQVEAPPASVTTHLTQPVTAAVSNAKRDSLDRFKKMPDLSKQTH